MAGKRAKSFSEIASQRDDEMDLAAGAFLIAADEYPDLDIRSYIRRLDMLASGVAERMPSGAPPLVQVGVINDYLFNQRRFRGNVENYYDPRNSYLNDVLDRRLGIPITLSVVYIEIASRLEIPIRGVGLPGHFVVKYDSPGCDLYVDPFNSGRILSTGDCTEFVLQAFGQLTCLSDYLKPISNRMILTRMLMNLKVIFTQQGSWGRVLKLLDKFLLLQPESADGYKERAQLYLSIGQYRAALCDLINYMNLMPQAPDAEVIYQQLDHIISMLHGSK